MTESIKRLDFEGEIRKRVGAKFFSACFIKKDGEVRQINCKFDVKKYLSGGVRTTDPKDYMIVWDTVKRQYRNVSLERLQWIKFNGNMYTVDMTPKGRKLKLSSVSNLI
tara:strand:- start:622 stop:948 length:327 start_codon:yes stop_codon:yes gene_type:complete